MENVQTIYFMDGINFINSSVGIFVIAVLEQAYLFSYVRRFILLYRIFYQYRGVKIDRCIIKNKSNLP